MVWNGCCLKTWSNTQTVIALSSGEAEYYAALKGAQEGLATQAIAKDLGLDFELELYTDSSACKGICARTGLGKVKHMEIVHLWLQGMVRSGRVAIKKVNGKENPADLMTKYLVREVMDGHLRTLGSSVEGGRVKNIDVY